MKRLIGMLCLGLVWATTPGCNAPAPTARSFSYLRLPSASKAQAFDAASQAMRERFRITRSDPAAGVIISAPDETTEAVSSGRLGDAVGVPRRIRKIATTRVTGSDTSAAVWCKVVVQQYETDERHLFEQERSLDDLPTATAADRGGATTPEQNAIWRTRQRDKNTERAILRTIAEIIDHTRKTDRKEGAS